MTPVLLPFGEGVLCPCGAIWLDESFATRCKHAPGAGRITPPPGDARRRLLIRYGDAMRTAGMVVAWCAGVVLFLYVIPKWVA